MSSLRIYLTLFLTFTLLKSEEVTQYIVSVWSVPVVEIQMILLDANSSNERELKFHTETTSIISMFFPVDNEYTTIFNDSTYQMLQFHKSVKQSNIEQEITIIWNMNDSSYHYDEHSYLRSSATHNIFSLLMRGRNTNWNDLDTKWFIADHEGTLYKSRFLWIDSTRIEVNGESILADHYRLDFTKTNDEQTLLFEMTDVFTWGIALEDCIRQIWIERNGNKRILRAEVSIKGWTLIAELNK